jgi:hypothetical protein
MTIRKGKNNMLWELKKLRTMVFFPPSGYCRRYPHKEIFFYNSYAACGEIRENPL